MGRVGFVPGVPTNAGPRSDSRGLRDAGLFQFTDFLSNGGSFQLGLGQWQARRDSRALVPGGRQPSGHHQFAAFTDEL